MELKKKLSKLRQEQNWSQAEVAQQLGITRQTVSKWERGLISPTTDKLIALCRLYGIHLDELLDGDSQLEKRPVVAVAEKPEESQPRKISPLRLAGAAVLAACILLVGVVGGVILSFKVLKEPETPKDGLTVTYQDNALQEDIDLEEVIDLSEYTTITEP